MSRSNFIANKSNLIANKIGLKNAMFNLIANKYNLIANKKIPKQKDGTPKLEFRPFALYKYFYL